MKARDYLLLVLLPALPLSVRAQAPAPVPQAAKAAAPLLFVQINGPRGLQATFYPPGQSARGYPAPAEVGLRPGYVYQFELTGLPERPDRPDVANALYPTLEVRGTVLMPPGLNAANYPVPVVFSPDEIARAQNGSFFTKVYFLECPDGAAPLATSLEQPLSYSVLPTEDPLEAARGRGRPLLIVRWGERQAVREELERRTVPGTLMFPGEKVLPAPSMPPTLPWACWPAVDPVLGPKPPCEIMYDGGDVGIRAGFARDGQLHGIDPSDTVAEYADSHGLRHVACSNRVCLFAPRFASVRAEILAAGYSNVVGPGRVASEQVQIVMQARTPSQVTRQAEQPVGIGGQQRPSVTRGNIGVVDIDQFTGLVQFEARLKGASITGICQKQPIPEPDRPLVLCKTANKQAVQVGDIVTFQLKYTNAGGQPITNVAISDSLNGRLEYVPGSWKSDREAVFTMQENEVGSLTLRWQFGDPLPPGQTGIITFEARVR